MKYFKRYNKNPVLGPDHLNIWESEAAFNGCPVEVKGNIHLLYRALSAFQHRHGHQLQLSTIGHAVSRSGFHFKHRSQLIYPEHEWEKFGCEDPRVTKIDDKFYIFYTALSDYPFRAEGIKVAVAITRDFKTIDEKRLVTPFNAKAMAFFPEKIKGKFAAVLTANTDIPPSKIGLAFFDREERLWSKEYWQNWYAKLEENALPLQRANGDQIEVGAPPVKTKNGWLLIYSYIKDYFSDARSFEIEAVLLDLKDPKKIIGRSKASLLHPEEAYELYGKVPNIVFPSGALVKKDKLYFYYGAADTNCCVAGCKLQEIIDDILSSPKPAFSLKRFKKNPILEPIKAHRWEAKMVFNPAAIYENNKVHIVYRAMSFNNTSVFGYATSRNGLNIDERLEEPIYVPREPFEKKKQPSGNSGCEDPRITKIGNTLYMLYTAFDGTGPPRVAVTSISLKDFLQRRWNWKKPVLISPPGMGDKDACIFPEKVNNKYMIYHRFYNAIHVSYVDNLDFKEGQYLGEGDWLHPRWGKWDDEKVGIAAPPIKTKAGWVMLYHGVSHRDRHYRVGALLLDLENPTEIISRADDPIFEPQTSYELAGEISNVVFPCGTALIGKTLYVYYGGADRVIGAATVEIDKLLSEFKL